MKKSSRPAPELSGSALSLVKLAAPPAPAKPVRKRKPEATAVPTDWAALARDAEEAGLLSPTARPAADSMARQIARLESRFERYYRAGEEDGDAMRLQYSPDGLERMGKCEKLLLELKTRYFEFIGVDRQLAVKVKLAELECRKAEDGDVTLRLEGFGDVPLEEENGV